MTHSKNHAPGVLIVLDWGTTNVRLALLSADGTVIQERRGISGVGDFTAEQFEKHFDELTDQWPDVPAIAAGMVGSRQGWSEAEYLPCPTSVADLAGGLHHIVYGNRTIAIVPGLKLANNGRYDVMRGEESQIAGYLTRHNDFSGTLLMPGTHSKWVHVERGTVVDFQTYMTGELFETLSRHSILRHSVVAPHGETGHFAASVQKLARSGSSIEGALFGLRARHLLKNSDQQVLHRELSALLIMAELKAGQKDGFALADNTILIGSQDLTRLYEIALQAIGLQATCIRGTALVWPALHDIALKSGMITGASR
jgi:2-dehydro-3-deoxygalactonokinase